MKRLLLLISVIALVVLPIGCVDIQGMIENTIENALEGLRTNYTIEVTGTEGLNFTGRYVVVTAAYHPVNYVAFDSTSYDVSGNVSKQYTITNAISVGGMFQKQSEEGTLTVKIWRGAVGSGTPVDSATTAEPFGAVLVTAVKE